MSTAFCSDCMKETDVRIEERREVLPVRGENVDVSARVAVCTACGTDVWMDELDDETLQNAFAEYRRRHDLLSPTDMRRLRQRWGLGQRAFALLLGWGEITLHRYETGSLQDAAHDVQLRMTERAENVQMLLQANGGKLTSRQREMVEARMQEAEAGEEIVCGDEDLERLLAGRGHGLYGGNVPISLSKMREVIAYFSELPDMFVTKLAKLMFYGDFLHYQEHSTSITGLAYAHAPQGPIPDKYERIRADVVENDVVRVEERNGMDWGGEVLLARRPVDWSVFSRRSVRLSRWFGRVWAVRRQGA